MNEKKRRREEREVEKENEKEKDDLEFFLTYVHAAEKKHLDAITVPALLEDSEWKERKESQPEISVLYDYVKSIIWTSSREFDKRTTSFSSLISGHEKFDDVLPNSLTSLFLLLLLAIKLSGAESSRAKQSRDID